MANSKIKRLISDVLSGREHANQLVGILKYISPDAKQSHAIEAIRGAIQVFTRHCNDGDLLFVTSTASLPTDDVYRSWLGERLNDCFKNILKCLCEDQGGFYLQSCMDLLRLKSQQQSRSSKETVFPEDDLSDLCKVVLSDIELVFSFNDSFLTFDDVRHYVLKVMPNVVNDLLNKNPLCVEQVFMFLQCIVSHMPQDGAEMTSCFVVDNENDCKFGVSLLQHRKKFSAAWLEFLKRSLPASVHKSVLVMLHTGLIPNFAKPRLLADFLMQSYSRGGGLALLGLHGLFVLIHQYNLEYPDFYKNVYAMLHPRVFSARYKARFFHLLDLFLSSTHIPAYLVAAFAKKLARLCLVAPADVSCVMVALILNLLRRHPNIRHLIHCEAQKADSQLQQDPFVEDEADPVRCRAMESSLWELSALKSHFSTDVVKCASVKRLGRLESDIGKLLDRDYDDLFNESCLFKFDESAMNHAVPESLFGCFEDSVLDLWDVGV